MFGWSVISVRLPSTESLLPTGSTSPYPAADSIDGATPLSMRKFTTRTPRPDESSQFDAKRSLWSGTLSVWPATWKERCGTSTPLIERSS